mgnify:CR=1 FL=1
MPKQVCILTLAKSNSNRLKNKNMKIFRGKPMLYWTIKKALKITKNYFVNSDSDEILEFSKLNGAKIIKRDKSLLRDDVSPRLIMESSFKYFPKNTNAVIHVQANSPNLEIFKIKKMYQIIRNTEIEDAYTIFSNNKLNGSMWAITKKRLKNLNKKNNYHSIVINSEFYLIDNSIDIHTLRDLRESEKMFDYKKVFKNI